MTKQQRDEFLLGVYEHQITNGHSNAGFSKDYNNPDDDYHEKVKIVQYWIDKGALEKQAEAIGFINFRLTSFGIDYVEDNLK